MGKDREFFALFSIFILIFSLLSMVTEHRVRALDVVDLLPRFHGIAPQRESGQIPEVSPLISPAMRSPLPTPPMPGD